MNYSTVAHLLLEKTFQVQDMLRWTALIRGHKGEESRYVAFMIYFVNFWNKLVMARIFM